MRSIEDILSSYDEFGNPKNQVSENKKNLYDLLTPEEKDIISKELYRNNINSPKDFILASSHFVSQESLASMFQELGIDDIEEKLFTVEDDSKKYVLCSDGSERVVRGNEVFYLSDYVDNLERNFSEIFSNGVYDQIEKSQKIKMKKIMDYITGNCENILDVCCGTGYSTLSLAKKFPEKKITAVDISQDALDILKRRANKQDLDNIETVCMDANTLHLNLERKYGVVTNINGLEDISNPWTTIYSMGKVSNGPILSVVDAYGYQPVNKWSGFYGMGIARTSSVPAPESERKENDVFVIKRLDKLA